jgi:hypothetical protein
MKLFFSFLYVGVMVFPLQAEEPISIKFANEEAIADALQSPEFRHSLKNALSKQKLDSLFNEEEKSTYNKGYIYLKAGATSGVDKTEPSPIGGIGYRTKLLNFENSTSFFSFLPTYSYDVNIAASAKIYNRYTKALELYLPKFSTLFYTTPKLEKSFYFGYGFAFATMTPLVYNSLETGLIYHQQSFIGYSTSLIAGYTPTLHQKYLNSIDLELNLPTITTVENLQSYENNWTINLTYSLGF